MDLDLVLLSRLQFAVKAMFHYLYPPLTMGLGVLIVLMEWRFLRTGDKLYEAMTRFWIKVFALAFALGVATGIVMEFEFGSNWSTYSRYVGDVFGSALASEAIFAFFLESGFLAILVFGWDKVSPRVHFFSTVMVSLGSIFSAIWILVAVSWMHTPAGHHIVATPWGPRAEILDFWAMVWNPSLPSRFLHTLVGAFILAAFFVMSVSAYYVLKGRHLPFATQSFKLALGMGLLSCLAQPLLGHYSAVVVAKHQPAKLAAFEGIFAANEPSAPLHLFGIPDPEAGEVKAGLAVPGMLSFLVHGDWQTPVTGLSAFPREDWPPVGLTFQSYHLMVALGMVMLVLTLYAALLLWRGSLWSTRWLLWVFVFAVGLPYLANQAGWVATEVGRQPWLVHGLLKTGDGVSKVVRPGEVLTSLTLFTLVYLLLFALFLFVLDRKIKAGPEAVHPPHEEGAEALRDALSRRGKTSFGLADTEER